MCFRCFFFLPTVELWVYQLHQGTPRSKLEPTKGFKPPELDCHWHEESFVSTKKTFSKTKSPGTVQVALLSDGDTLFIKLKLATSPNQSVRADRRLFLKLPGRSSFIYSYQMTKKSGKLFATVFFELRSIQIKGKIDPLEKCMYWRHKKFWSNKKGTVEILAFKNDVSIKRTKKRQA